MSIARTVVVLIIATVMACEDARLMDQEAEYLGILAENSTWEIEGGELVLTSGSATLVFRPGDAGP